jgi:hypothetical protein
MTLREAQKKWDDAIQLKCTHKRDSVSEELLIKWAGQSWDDPIKLLYVKVGRTCSRIIYSRLAAKEESRQKSLVPGTRVRMTGAEAEIENLKDTVFTVTHGPQWICGDWCVWLDKYSGAYCCQYLQKVEEL